MRCRRSAAHYWPREYIGYILLEGDIENPELLHKIKLLESKMSGIAAIEKLFGTANLISVSELIDKSGARPQPGASARGLIKAPVRWKAPERRG